MSAVVVSLFFCSSEIFDSICRLSVKFFCDLLIFARSAAPPARRYGLACLFPHFSSIVFLLPVHFFFRIKLVRILRLKIAYS